MINSKIKEGEYLAFSDGEYSDYSISGFFVAKKDFDIHEALEKWAEFIGVEIVDGYVDTDYDKIGFLPYLSLMGLVDEINYREIHTGSYGRVSL